MKPYEKVIGLPKMSVVSQPLTLLKGGENELETKSKKIQRQVRTFNLQRKEGEVPVLTEVPAPETATPETAAPSTTEKAKSPSEEGVLAYMKEAGKAVSSTEVRDHFNLNKETGRDTVRRVMAKLVRDKKVRIIEMAEAKRKQYVYELVK